MGEVDKSLDERELTEEDKKKAKKLVEAIGSKELCDGSSTRQGWVYHKIPFDGFEDVRTHKTACVVERNLVVDDLAGFDYQSVLDVGCSVGWFAFYFARLGKDVLGIEADRSVFRVARLLNQTSGLSNKLDLWNGSFDDRCPIHTSWNHDVVLFLNVHMWIERQIGLERTANALINLKLKRLYFQTAHADSGGKAKVERFKGLHDIAIYLRSCNFSRIKLLGETTAHGGVRYLFRAER